MTALLVASRAGWIIGWSVGITVVLVVVALVIPILLLAQRIGDQATKINGSLLRSVDHTAALSKLNDTNEAADAIVAGLARGRGRLGG